MMSDCSKGYQFTPETYHLDNLILDLFQILDRRGQGSIHLIKILTLSFYISCYPQFFYHYCKKLATSWTNVSIMIQSDQTPLSTLISWIKEKKEKARIIFLPCIFLSMLIILSFSSIIYLSTTIFSNKTRLSYLLSDTFWNRVEIDSSFSIVLIKIWKTCGKLWIEVLAQSKQRKRDEFRSSVQIQKV